MKLRLKLLLSFALSLLPLCSTQGCKSYQVRGFIIQLDSGPRNITVSLEKNQNMDLKLAHYRVSRTFRERMCHVINIKKRGPWFCVESETLSFTEVCRRGGESLHLFSYASATWTLDCPPDSGSRTLSCSGDLHPLRLQRCSLAWIPETLPSSGGRTT
ncbi:uncharacterized protein LOC119599086 [Penaeus monodon]|uniref:uncharacterized protein LOC119599086 n=1 Tax=Penaeus monodon TaxID=6687 RepID=UPI0018A6F02C|nr:uncharacterized protein LOC119599086 [Penaeus monodon]